jgi:glucose-1-phosphate adenylyltransferase
MCEGVQLRRCNIDRKMVVPAGEEIGVDLASDRQRFQISDSGIIVISRHDSFTRA